MTEPTASPDVTGLRPIAPRKMVHLCVDDWWNDDYSKTTGRHHLMACGMRQLADGHAWVYDTAAASLHVNCQECLPQCQRLGTPFSELSGRPGTNGYAKFVGISNSWGYP